MAEVAHPKDRMGDLRVLVDDQDRGSRLDDGPSAPPIPAPLLAPFLDVAGEQLRSLAPSAVPMSLRPLTGFDRRGLARSAARQQLLAAIEHDVSFREQVADRFLERGEVAAVLAAWSPDSAIVRITEAAARSDLPLWASALYARRPVLWQYGIGVVCAAYDHARRDKQEHNDTLALQTQLSSLDEAFRRNRAALTDAQAELSKLEHDLREERRARRAREEQAGREADGARARAAELDAKLVRAKAARDAAERRSERELQRARDTDSELRDLQSRIQELEGTVAEQASALETTAAPGSGLRYGDLQALADAADLAQRLANGLSGVVDQARRIMPVATKTTSGDAPERAPGSGVRRASEVVVHAEVAAPAGTLSTQPVPRITDARSGPVEQRRQARARGQRRRIQAPIPAGLTLESPEALDALLRVVGMVLVVDGYNVTMRAWPDVTPADQRDRLIAALGGLHARTRAEVTVVFDGADVGRPPSGRHTGVRVRFSNPGEEADVVVVREIAELPLEVPAVVVSSDNWVRDHAGEAGARVVSSETLLRLLRA